MSPTVNLIGTRIGRLIVVRREGANKNKRATWVCLCDCGTVCIKASIDLRNGDTQSCGCLRNETIASLNFKDLCGVTFGRITISRRMKNKGKRIMWLGTCNCGNYVCVSSTHLLSEHTQSCGCLKNENTQKRVKELINLSFGYLTVFKKETSAKNGDTRWCCKCRCGNICTVLARNLLGDTTRSCGCLQREGAANRLRKYVTGRRGKLHPCWKGQTPESDRVRKSAEYKDWRKEVLARDNYTCQLCKKHGGTLQAHHLKSFSAHKELRFAVDNGQTLCVACHRRTDNYGPQRKEFRV